MSEGNANQLLGLFGELECRQEFGPSPLPEESVPGAYSFALISPAHSSIKINAVNTAINAYLTWVWEKR